MLIWMKCTLTENNVNIHIDDMHTQRHFKEKPGRLNMTISRADL